MEPADLHAIAKPRYYDQQLLQVGDFQGEQDFHRASLELQTRMLYSPGVFTGLAVRLAPEGGGIVEIGRGLALNAEGRQILLVLGAVFDNQTVGPTGDTFRLDLTNKKYQGQHWQLTIEYDESADPADNRWRVYPKLSLLPGGAAPSPFQILLATIDVAVAAAPPGQEPVVTYSVDASGQPRAALRLPVQTFSADQITTGTLDASRLPPLPAGRVTGTLDAAVVPALRADKITAGEFDAARIPPLPVARLTGTFDASRIASGTLGVAQIPDLPAAKLVGSFDASRLATGRLDIARIPDIPAAKLTGRLDASQLPAELPTAAALLVDADKPTIAGEEQVKLTWESPLADEVQLEYIDEEKLVEQRWLASAGEAGEFIVTPYQTSVYTLTALRQNKRLARQQFTVQVLPNPFQYLKSLYFLGFALAEALDLCVNRYHLLPLTKKSLLALAAAAQRANYSEELALSLLQKYLPEPVELATPLITSFSNDDNRLIIKWDAVPNAREFALELKDGGDGGIKHLGADGGATELVYVSPTPLGPGTCAVKMQALAGDVKSKWSAVATLDIVVVDSPNHHWTFDEASGAAVPDAIGKVTGRLMPGVTRETPGCVGPGAIHLNGNDDCFVSFGSAVGQFKTGDFTVALWFKTTETLAHYDIIGNRTDDSHGNFFCLRMSVKAGTNLGGTLVAEVDQDTNATNYASAESMRTGLNDGHWHHVAVVRSKQTLLLYVDGALDVQTKTKGLANISNGRDFKLGRSVVNKAPRFAPVASYDELWVREDALTPAQIAELYRARQSGGRGTPHHWAFDEADGLQALDALGQTPGRLSASVVREAPGCVGAGALRLNGHDDCFVSFGPEVGQFGTDDFTVALWFKTAEKQTRYDIIGNRTEHSHGNFFCLRMSVKGRDKVPGTLVLEVDQDTAGTNYANAESTRTGLNDDHWHHVAMVRHAHTLLLYVDGVLDAQTTTAGLANITNGRDFRLGRSVVDAGWPRFAPEASFDELWVREKALDAAEIAGLFGLRPPG